MSAPAGARRLRFTGRSVAGGLGRRARRWRLAATTRARILGWYLALLVLALAVGLLVQRSILLAQLDSEVDRQLVQEVEELEQLSGGRDPNTGELFGPDVRAIFETFLSRNIPVEGEALFTIVDGRPFASTVAPHQLLDDPAIVALWAATTATERGTLESEAGEVRYVAVPVTFEEEVAGVFVVAMFMDEPRADVNRVLRTAGLVFGSTLLLATIVAWIAAGRVLRPIGLLTNAARKVSDSNWRERIPVRGNDEIVELTHTFNEMLERLEASFATQRRFIDDAGHELRTPITIIRGHLDLLGSEPRERDETMQLVDGELDRMARMVDDLLLLAKSEVPDFLEISVFDLDELTRELVAKAAPLGEREWRFGGAPALRVAGDRQRLTQAAMNLARNAVEHSLPGSPVTIGSDATGETVRIWVSDEGEGVDRGDRERIFDRFARGTGRRRSSEGAGLGLAIVRAIAEAHGGTVGVDSAPGRGATFVISIPIDKPGEGQP